MNWDTSPEAEAILFNLWRETPAWRKLELMEGLNRTARQLALMGLRRRFPNGSAEELRRRLASMILGDELAEHVYGPIPVLRKFFLIDSQAFQVALLVTNTLDELGVPYVIGGSMASIVHGMLRTTMDVDIVANVRPKHVPSLVSRLQDAFYADEQMIQQAIQHRGSFNLIHLNTMFKVDVFIPKDRPFDRQQLERRIAEPIGPDSDEKIWVLSAEDVVLAKLEWFRLGGDSSERQWRDILGVLKTQQSALDLDYLKHWAQALGVSDLMARALEELPNA